MRLFTLPIAIRGVGALLVAAVGFCGSGGELKPGMLPVYEFRPDQQPKSVPIALHNSTNEPLRYAVHAGMVFGQSFQLVRDGVPIRKAEKELLPPTEDDVRVLDPGDAAVIGLDLSSWYWTIEQANGEAKAVIEPGVYVLEIGIRATHYDLGLTEFSSPLRPVAIIIVKEDG